MDPRESTMITRLDDPALHEKRRQVPPAPPAPDPEQPPPGHGTDVVQLDGIDEIHTSADQFPDGAIAGVPDAEAPAPIRSASKMLAFFAPKGGVGATTLAVNVGGTLARMKRTAAIVDMDLQLGSVPITLNVNLERSIAELMTEAEHSRGGQFTSALDRHSSGLLVASQGDRIEELGQITSDRLPLFYESMNATVRTVMVDGLRDFSDHAVAVMDMAHSVVMVLTQDVPAVRAAARALRVFKRLGYPRDRIKLVLNRYHKKAPIPVEAIENALARPIDAKVVNDFPLVEMAVNEGMLLSDLKPGARIAGDIERLTHILMGMPVQESAGGGFFARLFRKG
ncbi:MAG: CpaE family protein [Bradymonadia bacterium]